MIESGLLLDCPVWTTRGGEGERVRLGLDVDLAGEEAFELGA
jgi:hypothetical protein